MYENEIEEKTQVNIDSNDPHTEIVAKYIVDKLISFAIFEENRKRIDRKLNMHCYDVFTKKVIQDLIGFEYMAHDKDEFSLRKEDYQEPRIFFDQVFFGSNNWSPVQEPQASKVDRTASTLIKSQPPMISEIQLDKEMSLFVKDKSLNVLTTTGDTQFSGQKAVPKKKTTTNLLNMYESTKKKTTSSFNLPKEDKKEPEKKEKDPPANELIDLKNPELYTYKEEEEIRIVREQKEDEWKKRIIEVATKEKNEKVNLLRLTRKFKIKSQNRTESKENTSEKT